MYRNVGALALLILAGCTTTGIDNNSPMSRDDAKASAKRVSGSDVAVCESISYVDDLGNTAYAYVVGWDGDRDGFAMVPTLSETSTDIYEEVEGYSQYLCLIEGLPVGYVLIEDDSDIGADCDDSAMTGATINPSAVETCGDEVDNDCDDLIDETGTATVSYPDLDGDGFGDSSSPDWSCTVPMGNIENGTDCDDDAEETFPGAAESDSSEDCMADSDSDGFGDSNPASGIAAGTDCDDQDWATKPGVAFHDSATDCMTDFDEDGYGDDSVAEGITAGTDCDDSETGGAINRGATEVCDSENVDEDCNAFADDLDSSATGKSTFYLDSDHDGYTGATTQVSCDQPTWSELSNELDCDDADATRSPGNPEVCDSGSVDEDCDTLADDADSSATGQSTWYLDSDHDGYSTGTTVRVSCDQPEWTELVNDSDCNDSSATVYPGATETCNEVDDDCDSVVDDGVQTTYYRDSDGDTYGNSGVTSAACSAPSGYVAGSTDCDDADSSDHPGGTETCNGDDEDCDGVADDGVKSTVYPDVDMDGYGDESASSSSACIDTTHVLDATDCNDGDVSVNPAASDTDNDGLDNDCDGEAMDEVCTTLVAAYSGKNYELWLSDLTEFSYTPDDPDWVSPGYAHGASVPVCGTFLLVEGNTLKFNAVIDYNADGTYGNSGDTYGFLYPGTNNFSTMTIMDESVDMANVSAGGDVTQIPWSWGTYTGNDGSVVIPELPN